MEHLNHPQFCHPKGIMSVSPRLRRTSYLGSRLGKEFNRNAVAANSSRDGRNKWRNRVAVGDVCWTITQGSAFRATLGFETESRWDSSFNQRGGLGKAHQLFGEQLPKLLDELNTVLGA